MIKPTKIQKPNKFIINKLLAVELLNGAYVNEFEKAKDIKIKEIEESGGIVEGEFQLDYVEAYTNSYIYLRLVFKGGRVIEPNKLYSEQWKQYEEYLLQLEQWNAEQKVKSYIVFYLQNQIKVLEDKVRELLS